MKSFRTPGDCSWSVPRRVSLFNSSSSSFFRFADRIFSLSTIWTAETARRVCRIWVRPRRMASNAGFGLDVIFVGLVLVFANGDYIAIRKCGHGFNKLLAQWWEGGFRLPVIPQ